MIVMLLPTTKLCSYTLNTRRNPDTSPHFWRPSPRLKLRSTFIPSPQTPLLGRKLRKPYKNTGNHLRALAVVSSHDEQIYITFCRQFATQRAQTGARAVHVFPKLGHEINFLTLFLDFHRYTLSGALHYPSIQKLSHSKASSA